MDVCPAQPGVGGGSALPATHPLLFPQFLKHWAEMLSLEGGEGLFLQCPLLCGVGRIPGWS